MQLKEALHLFVLLVTTVRSCKLSSLCNECIDDKCHFVVSRENQHVCIRDSETATNVRMVVETREGCKSAYMVVGGKLS